MDTPSQSQNRRMHLNTALNVARRKRQIIARRTGISSVLDHLSELLSSAVILGLPSVKVFSPPVWNQEAENAANRLMQHLAAMDLHTRMVWEGNSCHLLLDVPSGGRNW